MRGCQLESSRSGYGPTVGTWKRGNETSWDFSTNTSAVRFLRRNLLPGLGYRSLLTKEINRKYRFVSCQRNDVIRPTHQTLQSPSLFLSSDKNLTRFTSTLSHCATPPSGVRSGKAASPLCSLTLVIASAQSYRRLP
jgi:hypothetical protein